MINTKTQLGYTVLGTIIKNQSIFFENENKIKPYLFSEYNLKKIYESILDNSNNGQKITGVKIAVETGIEHEVINRIESFSDLMEFDNNLKALINIVQKEKFINLLDEAKTSVKSGISIDDAIKSIYENVDFIEGSEKDINKSHVSSLVNDVFDKIIETKDKGGLVGIDTGLKELNKLNGGFQKGKQIIIAGRPGMGKTTVLFSTIKNICINGGKGVLFNLEMSNYEIITNLFALVAGVPVSKIMTSDLSEIEISEIRNAKLKIVEWNLWVYDSLTKIDDIISETRLLNKKVNLDFMALDYLQLMHSSKRGNREEIVSDMSRRLKLLGKRGDCNLFTLVLSQLSRSVENRGGDKRPIMADLRESGSIEQDADQICFIYRPAYYGMDEGEDLTELIVAKNRGGNGRKETIKMRFTKNGFVDADDFDNNILGEFPKSETKQSLPYNTDFDSAF
jgi:replicative DNA helicase